MEIEKSEFNKLVENLDSEEKVKEATSKEVDAEEVYKEFKKYYYKVSHDDYYSAKKILDDNVELKKKLREEMRKLEELRNKATLNDEEREEVKRIKSVMDDSGTEDDKTEEIIEKVSKIEEEIRDLKISIKNLKV